MIQHSLKRVWRARTAWWIRRHLQYSVQIGMCLLIVPVSNTNDNQSHISIHQHRTLSRLTSSRRYCCSRLPFHETLLWIIQELTGPLRPQPQDAAKSPHTLANTSVCPSASQFCSESAAISFLHLHLVSFNHTAASPVLVWSHIIITGKNKAIEPLSERKSDVSEGGVCLLHLSALLGPLEKWTSWIL